jgi:hypothetical protein
VYEFDWMLLIIVLMQWWKVLIFLWISYQSTISVTNSCISLILRLFLRYSDDCGHFNEFPIDIRFLCKIFEFFWISYQRPFLYVKCMNFIEFVINVRFDWNYSISYGFLINLRDFMLNLLISLNFSDFLIFVGSCYEFADRCTFSI